MLYDGISRQQLLQSAVVTLQSASTAAGMNVYNVASWPTRPELFPMLLVEAPRERKTSTFPGAMQFNTSITLVVIGRVVDTIEAKVHAALDLLIAQTEDALLSTADFTSNIQQFTTVETTRVVTPEAKGIVGEFGMTFDLEVYQSYGPTGVPLTDISSTITNPNTGLSTGISFDVKPPQ